MSNKAANTAVIDTFGQFTDAHLHLAYLPGWTPVHNSPVCASSHTAEEFARCETFAAQHPDCVQLSFGIHPQNPDPALIPVLENLLDKRKLAAIGECGFDLFNETFASDIMRQESLWYIQVEYAARYALPLVVHCRKALAKIFRDSRLLAALPAVVFHSFSGSPLEAESLLKRGINAYFSLGKSLLNHNKRSIRCAEKLPLERLLAETDAPYQPLKGETATSAHDILRVYDAIARIRSADSNSTDSNAADTDATKIAASKIATAIAQNFRRVFQLG